MGVGGWEVEGVELVVGEGGEIRWWRGCGVDEGYTRCIRSLVSRQFWGIFTSEMSNDVTIETFCIMRIPVGIFTVLNFYELLVPKKSSALSSWVVHRLKCTSLAVLHTDQCRGRYCTLLQIPMLNAIFNSLIFFSSSGFRMDTASFFLSSSTSFAQPFFLGGWTCCCHFLYLFFNYFFGGGGGVKKLPDSLCFGIHFPPTSSSSFVFLIFSFLFLFFSFSFF